MPELQRWINRIVPAGRWRWLVIVPVLAVAGWSLLPFAFQLPSQLRAEPSQSIVITDRNGLVLDNMARPDYFRHEPVSLAEIPPDLIEATLVAEDKRFFEHPGIDYAATLRAFRDNSKHQRITSGASTITQQLIKISTPAAERNWQKKVRCTY